MQGVFDVTKFDARGTSEEEIQRALKNGTALQLLEQKCRVKEVYKGVHNRLADNLAGWWLDKLFSLGNCGNYFYQAGSAGGIWCIQLTTLSTEPGYTEAWSYTNNYTYDNMHEGPNSVSNSTSAKRFEEDQIEGWTIWTDPDAHRIHFKNKWLYTTTQANSNWIRSILIKFAVDSDDTNQDYGQGRGQVGRVRLKDANGVPVVITKNSNEFLLVEYQFTLFSM